MTSRRTVVKTLGTALGSGALSFASMRSGFIAEPIKVASWYGRPVADAGWNYPHDLGRRIRWFPSVVSANPDTSEARIRCRSMAARAGQGGGGYAKKIAKYQYWKPAYSQFYHDWLQSIGAINAPGLATARINDWLDHQRHGIAAARDMRARCWAQRVEAR